MIIKQHNKHFSTCEQINPSDIQTAVDQGYTLFINNRPDNEAEGQPSSQEMAAAVKQAGAKYIHIPIQRTLPQTDIDAMKQSIQSAQGPVLAFCRTGTRSTNLWIMTLNQEDQSQAMEHAKALGYDLGLATTALTR